MHHLKPLSRVTPTLGVLALILFSPIATTALAVAAISVSPLNFTAVEGEPRTDVVVATVVDFSGQAGPIASTINWGDGSPVASGVIVANRFDQFVAQLYQDLLHRSPGNAELTAAIALGTQSSVANSILGSAEYRTATVRSLYQKFLRRDADSAGLTFGVNFLTTGGTTDQLAAVILGSTEYFVSRGGSTNSGFVSALYLDLLGRPADSVGLSAYTQALNTGTTRGQIAFSIINSTEGRTVTVQGLYRRFLGRDADSTGLQVFLSFLSQGGTTDQVVASLVGSAEYFQHTGGTTGTYDILGTHTYASHGVYTVSITYANGTALGSGSGTATVGDAPVTPYGRMISQRTLFLDRLSQNLLGGPIDPFVLNSLLPYVEQSGRIASARVVHQSDDFAAGEVADFFNRYLGRTPSKAEIGDLLPAVHTGGEQLSARILSSDEYFSLNLSTAQGFIAGLYRDLLGRTPSAEETNALIGLLRTPELAAKESNRMRVALKVLRLPEARTFLVRGLYMTLLGRNPSTGSPRAPGELDRALTLLKHKTTWEGLADMIVGSQEYFAKATLNFAPGSEFTVTLGSFIDANPESTAADFTAQIDWGDGKAKSAGTIQKIQGVFYVSGTHVYDSTGTYPVTVTLSDDTLILSQVQVTGECPADVSDSATVIRANAKFDRITRHTTQKVTITNRGTTPITGPVYLLLDGLPFTATLVNGDGVTACADPIGRPFVKLDLAGDLAPGARTSVTLDFLNPQGAKVTYRTVVAAGPGTP